MFSALIIDADGKTPATLKSILAPYGFEFTVTENGPEAVNVARQAAPDIILLRAELPLTTGFSVCNRLRRNEDTRKIPLILYSSNASDDVIEQHRNLKTHADQYLRLPVDAERLLAAVKPYLKLGEARPTASPTRSESRPETRAKPRLEVELSESSGTRQPPPLQPASQQFEKDFGDEFGNLAGALQEDDDPPVSRRTAEVSRPESLRRGSNVPEDSSVGRISGPELAADGDPGPGGFKAQREALQLKSQLNAKNREILALKDELEARERAFLDAKKLHRELQSQLGELETQLVASQEQILESREATESAQRDKQTVLKREEGLKTRLEVTQKKLKDTETQLASSQQQLAVSQQQASAAEQSAAEQNAAHLATIADLEGQRDGLGARVQQLTDTVAGLQEELAAAREDAARLAGQLELAQHDLAEGLAAAREDRAAALAQLAQQHQSELDDRDQEHRTAIANLNGQLAELAEQSQQEQARLTQVLQENEENARLQIAQLTQTLAATEDNARAEIDRLTQNLATAEAHARDEIDRLNQANEQISEQALADADDAARKVRELEATLDDLSGAVDRAETALHRRREAALHATQALAVALRVLDSANSDSDAS